MNGITRATVAGRAALAAACLFLALSGGTESAGAPTNAAAEILDLALRETDRLGGHDPYSASKGMAELAIASYRESFFAPHRYEEHGVAVASVRAGNVIGGVDFADFRLVPDCMRALMAGEPIGIRVFNLRNRHSRLRYYR